MQEKQLLAVQKDALAQELILVKNVMVAIYRQGEEQANQQADKQRGAPQPRQQVIDAHLREVRGFEYRATNPPSCTIS